MRPGSYMNDLSEWLTEYMILAERAMILAERAMILAERAMILAARPASLAVGLKVNDRHRDLY